MDTLTTRQNKDKMKEYTKNWKDTVYSLPEKRSVFSK